MNLALQCSRCGREMHSSGLRGMCPQCLFVCSTEHFSEAVAPAPPEDDAEELASDRMVGPNKRFLLLDKLGEGGMGEVWLADDRELSQPGEPQFVALKFLSKSIRHDPRAIQTVRAEVRRSQTLTHANIVRIFDLHTTRAGLPFIKMEFVEGNSLSQWLRTNPDHLMPWRQVAQLTGQLAGALTYAHESAGIVHRDLKPANLLLAQGEIVKLSDFGISQALRQPSGRRHQPAGGTLAYAGPQQIAGEPPSPADDIYSLGATLYELLTGTTPFQARTVEEMIEQVNHQAPIPIPERLQALGRRDEVPRRLVSLVQRCLDKDPVCRPSISEVARQLPLVAGPAPQESRTSAQVQVDWEDKPARSRRFAEWFWVTLLLMVLLGIVAWVLDVANSRERVARGFQTLNQRLFRAKPDISGPTVSPPSESIPSSNPPPAQAEPSPSPLAAPLPGRLALSIDSAIPYVFYDCEVQAVKGTERFAWRLPRGSRHNLRTNLPAGEYLMSVTAGGSATASVGRWTVSQPVVIQPDATSTLRFPFREAPLTIETEPPGAAIHWLNAPTNLGQSPYTARFRSGSQQFTALLPGYRLLTTNLFFDPEPNRNAVLRLTLEREIHPVAGEDWTNSIGMPFKWVQSIQALVSLTETRVAHYRQFVRSSPGLAGATNLYSLTVNGWEQQGGAWESPGFAQTDEYPVVGVSWEDAIKFCEWLTTAEHSDNRLAGNQRYALPTAAEWVQLVRGALYPWEGSETELPSAANYAGREAGRQDWPPGWPVLKWREDNWPRTAPVAQGKPSRTGLYDLAGNAAEWCAEKVLCGGSWFDGEWYDSDNKDVKCLQTQHTEAFEPSRRDSRNGFRIILPLGDRPLPDSKP